MGPTVFIAIGFLVAVFLLRQVVFDWLNKKKQIARTAHPSDAKLEYMNGDSTERIVSVKRSGKKCKVTISTVTDGQETVENQFETGPELLDELEEISERNEIHILKKLPYSSEYGRRSFSLFFGNMSVEHIDSRQESHPQVKSFLDEIEGCIKKYI